MTSCSLQNLVPWYCMFSCALLCEPSPSQRQRLRRRSAIEFHRAFCRPNLNFSSNSALIGRTRSYALSLNVNVLHFEFSLNPSFSSNSVCASCLTAVQAPKGVVWRNF